ncbi:pyridoxamine 5'-phosphate oxidase family protein [Corynebacterium breve]|uniref:Pyridoxamine 5'-phosphate oxidase family protein n=1 Tax=Corynebacterium breve TaxID=3049799 RepID=A0ABY8VF83_9CORY|nr:pyridoxamine 5'-phosphate oxidase family protein [Corynebacterium breve]WIM67772.1 pyridoxamine 5'-phosphate oxidase family protein [Corynebacterium breve]
MEDITYEQLAYDEHVRRRQNTLSTTLPTRQGPFEFDPRDLKQIKGADSFFLSTVTGSGWPYIQHRGGPAGFVKQLSPTTLAWAELRGNNQYVTTGNLDRDGRVAMFFIDYPTRRRLKVFGHARIVEDDPELLRSLTDQPSRRAIVVSVTATDKNCVKHIQPRWTKDTIDERLVPYIEEIRELKARIKELEGQ